MLFNCRKVSKFASLKLHKFKHFRQDVSHENVKYYFQNVGVIDIHEENCII